MFSCNTALLDVNSLHLWLWASMFKSDVSVVLTSNLLACCYVLRSLDMYQTLGTY